MMRISTDDNSLDDNATIVTACVELIIRSYGAGINVSKDGNGCGKDSGFYGNSGCDC